MTPPATLWEQFAIIGVVMACLILIGTGAGKLFDKFTAWQKSEAEARENERERHRAWMEGRDGQWQGFFSNLNSSNTDAIERNTTVLMQLVEQFRGMSKEFAEHNEFVRRNLPASGARRDKGGGQW